MEQKVYDYIIIGSGFGGAVSAMRLTEKGYSVLILEKGAEVLAKVRISGGGRCNVTHAGFDPALLVKTYPRGAEALRGPFTRSQPRDTVAWFAARGVALKTLEDGCMFPATNRSETIIDCFRNAAAEAGVEVQTNVEILSITREGTGFVLAIADGRKIITVPADGMWGLGTPEDLDAFLAARSAAA